MIASIGLGPRLIQDLTPAVQPSDLPEFIDRHLNIVDALREHGRVVASSGEDLRAIADAVRALGTISPDAAQRWKHVLKFLNSHRRIETRTPPADPTLERCECLSDLKTWANTIDVAALPSGQATRLGVPDSERSTIDPVSGIEVARGSLLHRSQCVRSFRSSARNGVIPHASSRDDWLRTFMLPVLRQASRIDIVDHYLFKDLCLRRLYKRPPAQPEHIVWLLQAIGTAGGPQKAVRLVGGSGDGQKLPADASDAVALLRDARPSLGRCISQIDVVITDWRRGGGGHDRHLLTDVHVAFEFPAGFDRFSRPLIQDVNGVKWIYTYTRDALEKCRNERDRVVNDPKAVALGC